MLNPIVRYSVLRLGFFALALVLLGLAGARGWLLVLLAALVSLALSYLLLGRLRNQVSAQLADRAAGRHVGETDEDAEDAQLDADERPGVADGPAADRDRDQPPSPPSPAGPTTP